MQILHQLVVTVLSVDIGLTVVEHLDYHLEVEVQYRLQNLSVYVEVRVVNLQHVFLLVLLNQEYLRLTRILAQNLQFLVVLTFKYEYAVIDLVALLL